MKNGNYQLLSKTIAHALRHEPGLYGLELDKEGWAVLDDLVEALKKYYRWQNLEKAEIEKMNAVSEKKRFEIKADKIRALYGHSSGVGIEKIPSEAPEFLFHGTTEENAEQILKQGLQPMERQFVHLSADKNTAWHVGKRKTNKPVILEIEAKKAAASGVRFYLGNDTIWLADPIPALFIKLSE